eukprot:snap_masked-scaffold_41-processed-gene-1.4-mRNA-1 protein AED:1.00 eAED:1.00 QI:0/-1/0/0/-1/1/1/0/937
MLPKHKKRNLDKEHTDDDSSLPASINLSIDGSFSPLFPKQHKKLEETLEGSVNIKDSFPNPIRPKQKLLSKSLRIPGKLYSSMPSLRKITSLPVPFRGTKSFPQRSGTITASGYEQAMHTLNSRETKAQLNIAKVLIVGPSGSGKTTLLNSLLDPARRKRVHKQILRVSNVECINSTGQWTLDGQNIENYTYSKFGNSNNHHSQIPSEFPNSVSEVPKEKLGLTVYDFSGAERSRVIHHCFIGERNFFIGVFNAEKMYREILNKKIKEITLLKGWIQEKLLRTSHSRLVLVGTHCANLAPREIKELSVYFDKLKLMKFMKQEVFKSRNTSRNNSGFLNFVPVDFKNRTDVSSLKSFLHMKIQNETYLQDEVVSEVVDVYKALFTCGSNFLQGNAISEVFSKSGLHDRYATDKALCTLYARGLIGYYTGSKTKTVIIDPVWLINALVVLYYDPNKDEEPECDGSLYSDLVCFRTANVVCKDLLHSLWYHLNYGSDFHHFLIEFCAHFLLLQEFPPGEEFLTTITEHYLNPLGLNAAEDYTGPSFYIALNLSLRREKSEQFYIGMHGFFEIFCLNLYHDFCNRTDHQPMFEGKRLFACLDDNTRFHVELHEEEQLFSTCIKVSTYVETRYENALNLKRTLEEIVKKSLKNLSSRKELNTNNVRANFLVPPTDGSNNILISLKRINEPKNKNRGWITSSTTNQTVKLCAYEKWFQSNISRTEHDVGLEQEFFSQSLNQSTSMKIEVIRERKFSENTNVQSIRTPITEKTKMSKENRFYQLPSGFKHHCFISYRQKDSNDVAENLYLHLQGMKYKCWFDQHFTGTKGLNRDSMREGVEMSWCYILILSEHCFESSYVQMELKTAIEMNKPIFLVSHPDTVTTGKNSLDAFISASPDILKPYYEDCEVYKIMRQYKMKQQFLNKLDAKLRSNLKEVLDAQDQ